MATSKVQIYPIIIFVYLLFDENYIFFQQDQATKTVNQVSVIDWQWCGTGLGICDVMYLILGTYNLGLHVDNFALEKRLVKYPSLQTFAIITLLCLKDTIVIS